MALTVEVEQEEDGRWIAEVPELPGVLAYGQNRDEAVGRAEALALRVLADRIEASEPAPEARSVFAVSP
jgi:predicted RNase H-like HicB family nuclease